MKKFLYSLNDFIGVDHYFLFFENEDVENTGPSIVAEIVFGFTYLKLIDGALKHSKEDVLAKYEENRNSNDLEEILMNAAVYPSGETLGFYNTSKYDIGKLCDLEYEKECSELLPKYIAGFSKNVREAFDELEFEDRALKYLDDTLMTLQVLKQFNATPIEEDSYSSYDKFMKTFSDFIHAIWTDEIYCIVSEPISNYDVLSSYHYIHEAVEEYGSFLNTLLLMDGDFENGDDVKIYDPDSSGAYILNDAKEQIELIKRNSGNLERNVEIYGKSKKTESRLLYLVKKSVSKKDPYEIEDATILDISEDIFSIDGIEGYDDFNLIISNYLYNDLDEYREIFEIFKKGGAKSTKLVIALNSFDDFADDLTRIIENDNLESLISFKNHYVIIANTSKSESKKGSFLLIDESDAETSDELVKRENEEAFSNNAYDFFSGPRWKTLTKSDHDKMKRIIDSYRAFEDGVNSILIKNDEYDEEMIKILLN